MTDKIDIKPDADALESRRLDQYVRTVFTERENISPENLKVLDSLVQMGQIVNNVIDLSASGNLDRPLDTSELQYIFLCALVDANPTRWASIVIEASHFQISEISNAAVKRATREIKKAKKQVAEIRMSHFQISEMCDAAIKRAKDEIEEAEKQVAKMQKPHLQ